MPNHLLHLDYLSPLLMNKYIVFFFLILTSVSLLAQDNPYIKVNGKVYDPREPEGQVNLMIVNRSELVGVFGNNDGTFQLTVHKNDSLMINAVGYKTIKMSFKDSVLRKVYELNIALEPIQFQLREVAIFSKRDLNEIQEDIQKLGYNEEDYILSGVDAIQSPITFLYQMFSKREQSRRKVAELENEDRKRGLLRELFRQYVDADIINLSDTEFDDFIAYCDVSDEFMKRSSQYEFCLYVKHMFIRYRNRK